MAVTLQTLAELTGGLAVGDSQLTIGGVAALAEAGPGDITFVSNPRYRPLLPATRAAAVIAAQVEPGLSCSWIVHPNPYLAFANVLQFFHPMKRPAAGIHPSAVLGEGCTLGEGVSIGPGAVLGRGVAVGDRAVIHANCVIGDGVTLGSGSVVYPLCVIWDGCRIGQRVIVGPGCVIGSDGYGFARDGAQHVKIPQIGWVTVEDDVELGAGVTIDRGALGETRIGRGTKIDNQVHVAHNVAIGEHCLLVAQVGISGSAVIGDRVVIAGQSGVGGHITVASDVVFSARAGVTRDVPAPGIYSGYPARPHGEWKRELAAAERLPELLKQVRQLAARIEQLEAASERSERGE